MKISFAELGVPKAGTVVVGVGEDRVLSPAAAALDKESGGALARAMASSRFTGKKGQLLAVLAPANLAIDGIVLAGLGKPAELDALALQALGGSLVAHLNGAGESEATVRLGAVDGVALPPAEIAANVAFGARLRSYRFDKYRTRMKAEQKPTLKKLAVQSDAATAAKKFFADLDKLADGVFFTRDLVSEPGNVLYPESLAEQASSLAELGVEVEVLDEKKMKKLGMGALLGVGQGSVRPPRLVVMAWLGAKDKQAAPVAVVGKGITFDTGGISLKPGAGMEEMKWDMGGSGTVIGLMKALAGRKARANVVGVVALAENMPDGNAIRPGDILTSMSGQTIEVNNTDAEGRLVLADALWYAQDRFKPRLMIDLATLTGAILVALGSEYAGLFSNNDELAERLAAAGKAVGEPLWRMPLGEAFDRAIDSDVADMKNITGDRNAGSSIGGVFLQRFVNGVPWAHLDIAGMAWSKKDAATVPKGATGYGVRLLERFIAEHYED
ncbi:putative cytosol aminopeptidase [Aliidongia dinghuensis]|uniref:Probable cytosol aminopeptidase n=1 Tax=Aliidongia dinghuensis TaxID=1867774 RepID=A0A8J2YUV1_9PROT|nr:leucyl aminopeptidase [Aliidongia dinghuensis]GGF25269.1 putative cytosol aminopeptidase [Aliidongia dinghuensis]